MVCIGSVLQNKFLLTVAPCNTIVVPVQLYRPETVQCGGCTYTVTVFKLTPNVTVDWEVILLHI